MASKATENFVEKCQRLYKEADTDNNGLTVGELHGLIRKLCNNSDTSDRMIAEIFADLDDDGDKKLSWDEFSDVCCKKDPKTVQENELRCVFKGADKDGSGRLTVDEIRKAFKELGIKSDPEESLAAADADGDGKVDFNEFLTAFSF